MKRFLFLVIIAFLISGGTVAILFQEGIGGLNQTESEPVIATEEDLAAAEAEEEDIASSYGETAETAEVTDTTEPEATDLESMAEEAAASETESETEDTELSDLESEEDTEAQMEAEAKAKDALRDDIKSSEEAETEEETEEKPEVETATSGVVGEEDVAEADNESDEEFMKLKESKAPYYGFQVLGYNNSPLILHKGASGKNDSIGTVKIGTRGYVIEKTKKSRTLVYVDGKVGYISTNYIETAEIDIEDYPDALVSISGDDAGKEFDL